MIEKLSERLANVQINQPKTILAIIVGITVLLVPGMMNLEVKPSTEAILPADDEVVQSLDTLRNKFSGDTTYIVYEAGDVRKQQIMENIVRVGNRLKTHPDINRVDSAAHQILREKGEIPDEPALEQRRYDNYISEDYTLGIMAVSGDTQADASTIRSVHDFIEILMQNELPNISYSLTGYNMIDLATFQVIINDFSLITMVSFTAVLSTLYVLFRSFKKMFMPLIPVLLALIWMLGIGGYLGVDLTIISMVSAAMIMGLGIDFGIHVTKRFYRGEKTAEELRKTMKELSRGLLGGALTTSVGFLSLLAATLSGMHDLGIFLFTGILSAYVGAVFLLPTILSMLERLGGATR